MKYTPPAPPAQSAASRPATIDDVLARRRPPHELDDDLHDLWRDGFHEGAAAMQPRIDRAESDADRYYYLAFNADEERRRHRETLRAFDIMQARRVADERRRNR